jgi:hypothetical protein
MINYCRISLDYSDGPYHICPVEGCHSSFIGEHNLHYKYNLSSSAYPSARGDGRTPADMIARVQII